MGGNYTEITEVQREETLQRGDTRGVGRHLRGIYMVRGLYGKSFALKKKKKHT